MKREDNSPKRKLNLPNTLSLLRVCMVPLFVLSAVLMRGLPVWGAVVPLFIYVAASLTDMLDGKIARKYGLITDFGKFIDPLADKFMVLSAFVTLDVLMALRGETVEAAVFLAVVLTVLFRELGVTSLRLVVAGSANIVVAASMLGKIKTVSQMAGTVLLILEPWLFSGFDPHHIIAYCVMAVMAFTTLFSGIDYLRAYLPYVDAGK